MISKVRELYDNLYYEFQKTYDVTTLRFKTWKKYLGVKFDKDFYTAYKMEIRPYWRQFGITPARSMVKSCYSTSSSLDPRCITDDIWQRYIIPYFNDRRFSRTLTDKNLNSLLYPGVKRPETLFKYMSGRYCLDDFTPITAEAAVSLCRQPGHWVIKPTMDSYGGQSISFFDGGSAMDEIKTLLSRYDKCEYIVQRQIVQHSSLNAINASSVNTVRIVTVVFREQAQIDSIILRAGFPGSRVDNLSSGGYQFAVRPDGTLNPVAFTNRGTQHRVDFSDNPAVKELTIPSFDVVCSTALALAAKTPHLHLIAWDFSIDSEGEPVLIEFNAYAPGQNQETNGPTFGDRSYEILTDVFSKRKAQK